MGFFKPRQLFISFRTVNRKKLNVTVFVLLSVLWLSHVQKTSSFWQEVSEKYSLLCFILHSLCGHLWFVESGGF